LETHPAAPTLALPSAKRNSFRKETDELKTEVAQAEAAPENAKKGLANSDLLNGKPLAPPPPAPPPAAATPQFQAADELANRNAPGAAPDSPARDKPPARERADEIAPSATGAAAAISKSTRSMQTFSSALNTANLGEILIAAPSGKILWRAGKAGKIQRSVDAGRTWILQASPLTQDWTAGSAPVDTVCWLVGRNGAIARTADGEHWAQIVPPVQASGGASQLPDWAGVTAARAQDATITSSDQKRYRTQDGGQTWQLQ